MKYILYVFDKDPKYGIQVIKCDTAQEANKYKKKAIEQGFKVTVKGEKKNERN